MAAAFSVGTLYWTLNEVSGRNENEADHEVRAFELQPVRWGIRRGTLREKHRYLCKYVNEGIIAAVVDHGTVEPGYEFVDCAGLYAVPGLINLHVHLFGTGKPSKALSGGGSAQTLIKLTKTALGA